MRYETDHGGWRISTSNGGIGTGEHPDFLVADDFFNSDQGDSETERKSGIDWWDGTTIPTRGITRDVRRVVIGQRFHEDDLSGHLLAEGGWEHICLPMEFEPDRMQPTSLGWTDPRTEPGELLWPALFPATASPRNHPQNAPAPRRRPTPTMADGPAGRTLPTRMVPHHPRDELPPDLLADSRVDPLLGQGGHRRERRVHGRRVDGQARPAVVRARRQPRPMGGPRSRKAANPNDGERRPPLSANYSIWQEQEPGSGGKESAENTTRNLAGYAIHTERVTGRKRPAGNRGKANSKPATSAS